jgi:shikimate dehydrogenase
MNISALIQKGIARIAELPPNNWKGIGNDTAPLTVPLIAEDYPAKTAVMWNAMYSRLLVPDRNMMLVADPKYLDQIMKAFRADTRYRGGGAGVGFKEAIIPYLDEVTPLAKAMGAVNIVKKDDHGRLIGDNTDGVGYASSLEDVLVAGGGSLKNARVLMLGAGGSGRAIAFALADKGAQLTILNRTESKARELANTLNDYFKNAVAFGGGRILLPSVLDKADAIVSVIDDAVSPLDAYSTLGDMILPVTEESIMRNCEMAERLLADLDRRVVISDIRIRKEPTAMLVQARALGFRTLDGIPMVVNQGAAAFWWLYGDQLVKRGATREDVAETMRVAAGL